MVTVNVRSITGSKVLPFDFDLGAEVSEIKGAIANSSLCKGAQFEVEFNGHEISDNKTLSYYGVKEHGLLQIAPPWKLQKLSLQFEKPDGTQFALQVRSNITVAQLMRYIFMEEKLDIRRLTYASALVDSEDPDLVIVSEPQELPEKGLLSQFPLEDSVIYVNGPRLPPLKFDICVVLHENGKKLTVQATSQHTLHDFKEAVRAGHGVPIDDHVLILLDKEVVGEDTLITELEFGPGSTIYAVPFLNVEVEIIGIGPSSSMRLHPLTKLSEIRRVLAKDPEVDDPIASSYSFTIDGKEQLMDWRTLWNLDFISGSTLYMRPAGLISFVVNLDDNYESLHIDAEEDETVFGLKERLALAFGIDMIVDNKIMTLVHRGKELMDWRMLRDEGLKGGEHLTLCLPC